MPSRIDLSRPSLFRRSKNILLSNFSYRVEIPAVEKVSMEEFTKVITVRSQDPLDEQQIVGEVLAIALRNKYDFEFDPTNINITDAMISADFEEG